MKRASLIVLLCATALAAAAAHGQVRPQDIQALWSRLPRPRIAVAPTKISPAIDGQIGADEWRSASKASDFIGIDSPQWKGAGGFDAVSAQTTVWVTRDAANLYVAFRCEEPEIETLKVLGQPGRDGALWRDDCVELFLVPPGADYRLHFIVNSKGWVFDAKVTPTDRRGSAWDLEGLKVAAFVSPPGAGSYWSVELALPLASMGAAAPKDEEVWGVNFARERWAATYKAIAELSTWSGLVGSFEQPEMFGEMCFGDLRQDIALPRPFLGRNEIDAGLTNLGPKARPVKLELLCADSSGAAKAGSAEVTLPPGQTTAAKAQANIQSEGLQMLALVVSDAATGRALSVTRVPFEVPDVLTAAGRVRARLAALRSKAGEGDEFARGLQQRLAEVEAVQADAKKLLARLAGATADEALRQEWQALRARVGELEAAVTFVVWTCSPYIATGPGSMPPALAPPPTLKIEAARNEYAHVVLNVTNLTDEGIEFQLDARLPGQVGPGRSGLDTTAQDLARFQPKVLGKNPRDLPEKPDGLAMPLVELNDLGTFFVRPLSTRQVWLTVQTRDLKGSAKPGGVRLVPLSAALPAVSVPVELTVWDFTLEDVAPIGVFCFDYAGDYEWMKQYKINTWFRGAFPSKLELGPDGKLLPYKTDIDRVKKRMAEGARKFLFSYGYAGSFIQWAEKNKIAYMSDQWKALFKEILSRMISEWLAAGLGYDDFALQSIDEAHGRGTQQVIETTPLIRQVDPKVRLAMTIMTDLKELKQMAPHVDLWLNRNGAMWGPEQIEFFRSERAKGKPIWSWNMPNNPKSDPLTQFRTYGWRAAKFDFDAIGFFLYFGMVYQPQRPGGGIATRHWEAWRDGVEDYQILRTLRDEIDKARKQGLAAEKLQGAADLLAKAVDDVIGKTFFPPNTQETHERIEQARRLVAAEILRVRKLK